jgi:hypothetical protein
MGNCYDGFDFGPVMVTYSFKPGQPLPKIGETISDDKCTMVITDIDAENNLITVLVTSTESVSSRIDRYKEEIDESIDQIAALLYKRTSEGMTSLIGWDNLTDEIRKPYFDLAYDIVMQSDDKNLLILKYS